MSDSNKRFSTNLFRGWRARISSAIEQLQQPATNLLKSLINISTPEAPITLAQNMEILAFQEHSVSPNGALIFFIFSSYFLAIFCHLFRFIFHFHGNKATSDIFDRRHTTLQKTSHIRKSPVATTTSGERTIIIHRLAEVVPRHKNAHRAHWFIL